MQKHSSGHRIAVYPGSFDPWHHGHTAVLRQAVGLFDKILVVVTRNLAKPQQNAIETRIKQVQRACQPFANVTVISNERPILTVAIAQNYQARYLIRGVRQLTDCATEFEYATANHKLDPQLITVWFLSYDENRAISSRLQREIKALHRD